MENTHLSLRTRNIFVSAFSCQSTNYGMQPPFLLSPLCLPETSQANSTTCFDNMLKLEAWWPLNLCLLLWGSLALSCTPPETEYRTLGGPGLGVCISGGRQIVVSFKKPMILTRAVIFPSTCFLVRYSTRHYCIGPISEMRTLRPREAK